MLHSQLQLRNTDVAPVTVDEGFDARLEVRDAERREIYGRIIPYGEEIRVRGRPERFVRGAVDGVDPATVRLLAQHREPIGRMISLEERDDGAYATFRVSRTRTGDEMLQLVADGVIDSFSPGFIPGDQAADGTIRRLRALPEVSLVTFPAYSQAKVLAIREEETPMPEETQPVETPTETPPAGGDLERRFDEFATEIRRDLAHVRAVVEQAPQPQHRNGPNPFHLFLGALAQRGIRPEFAGYQQRFQEDLEAFQTRVRNGEVEIRALQDITGDLPSGGSITDLSAVVVEEFMADQLVSVLDTRRRAFNAFGSIRGPRSGHAKIPRITQHTLVAARAGQKQTANSRKLVSDLSTYEAGWVDGAVDVAIELIQTAEIGVLELVWNDLVANYAIATEHDTTHGAVPFLNGASAKGAAASADWSYHDAALDTSTYAKVIDDILAGAEVVEDETGALPTQLAVTRAQWRVIMAMVDTTGRRLFAPIGAQNADGTAGILAQSIDLNGLRIFPVKGLNRAVMWNESALKAHDYGFTRVEATNVELMGRDIGILGRTLIVDRIPSGIYVYAAGASS